MRRGNMDIEHRTTNEKIGKNKNESEKNIWNKT